MAFTHTKKVYSESFIKGGIRIRSKKSGSDLIRIRNTDFQNILIINIIYFLTTNPEMGFQNFW
jgi:hypothetical protein